MEKTPKRVAAWSGYPEERILGAAEVAARFGVTRQRVGQIARTDRTFPRPGLTDGSGGAWLAAGIEGWAAAHRPTADTGRFGPEVAALLINAESIAELVGHAYIASSHVWHALASDVDGAPLAQAIRSMGLDPPMIEEWLRRIDPGLGPTRPVHPRPRIDSRPPTRRFAWPDEGACSRPTSRSLSWTLIAAATAPAIT